MKVTWIPETSSIADSSTLIKLEFKFRTLITKYIVELMESGVLDEESVEIIFDTERLEFSSKNNAMLQGMIDKLTPAFLPKVG